MTFTKWVQLQGGAPKVAKMLGVCPHAVRNWLRGQSRPAAKHALKINSISNGRVTLHALLKIGTRKC